METVTSDGLHCSPLAATAPPALHGVLHGEADARSAAQVLGRGAQSVAREAARCAPQVLDSGAQAFFSAAPLFFLSQVLVLDAEAVARGVATAIRAWRSRRILFGFR
jgi:hypothetical protein